MNISNAPVSYSVRTPAPDCCCSDAQGNAIVGGVAAVALVGPLQAHVEAHVEKSLSAQDCAGGGNVDGGGGADDEHRCATTRGSASHFLLSRREALP